MPCWLYEVAERSWSRSGVARVGELFLQGPSDHQTQSRFACESIRMPWFLEACSAEPFTGQRVGTQSVMHALQAQHHRFLLAVNDAPVLTLLRQVEAALFNLREADHYGLVPTVFLGDSASACSGKKNAANTRYHANVGDNVWDYYFQPLASIGAKVGEQRLSRVFVTRGNASIREAYARANEPRQHKPHAYHVTAARLVRRFLRIRPELLGALLDLLPLEMRGPRRRSTVLGVPATRHELHPSSTTRQRIVGFLAEHPRHVLVLAKDVSDAARLSSSLGTAVSVITDETISGKCSTALLHANASKSGPIAGCVEVLRALLLVRAVPQARDSCLERMHLIVSHCSHCLGRRIAMPYSLTTTCP